MSYLDGIIDQLQRLTNGKSMDDFTRGERHALLQVRKFITTQGLKLKGARLVKEIDAYLATRLSDIREDDKQPQEPQLVVCSKCYRPIIRGTPCPTCNR